LTFLSKKPVFPFIKDNYLSGDMQFNPVSSYYEKGAIIFNQKALIERNRKVPFKGRLLWIRNLTVEKSV
jgi:hypothetical protein